MDKFYLEIREAEGGTDSKLIVDEMKIIYERFCNSMNFKTKTID